MDCIPVFANGLLSKVKQVPSVLCSLEDNTDFQSKVLGDLLMSRAVQMRGIIMIKKSII